MGPKRMYTFRQPSQVIATFLSTVCFIPQTVHLLVSANMFHPHVEEIFGSVVYRCVYLFPTVLLQNVNLCSIVVSGSTHQMGVAFTTSHLFFDGLKSLSDSFIFKFAIYVGFVGYQIAAATW